MTKHLLTLVTLVLLAGLSLAGCNKHSLQDAKIRVNDFYKITQKLHPEDRLSLDDLLRIRNFLSVALFEQVKELAIADEELENESEGPPQDGTLIAGNIFSGHPDGFDRFRIINCELQVSSGTCRVELTLSDPAANKPMTWVDEVLLIQDTRGWIIDDIKFPGGGASLRSGLLNDMINAALQKTMD